MIRISKLADYSVVILAELSKGYRGEPAILSAMAIAAAIKMPETTVAKVMKTLARSGLLHATRGAAGGYALARPVDKISICEVIEAMDGPIGIVDCTQEDRADCLLAGTCELDSNWALVNDTIRTALSNVTLADMIKQQEAARGVA